MSTGDDIITCRATAWYHKRRIAMLILIFGLMIAFIYDWQIRYPRLREAQTEFLRQNREKGIKDNTAAFADGTEEYAAMAKQKGWPEKPDLHKNYDFAITWEQPGFALLCAVAGVIMLFHYIRTCRGALTADATSFSTTDGHHVPFASATRIDRRKWEHKGLAYVYYTDDKGREKRAVIDDLVFGGAVKVLDRLVANFKGDIIDLEKTEEESAAAAEPDKKEPPAETASVAPASSGAAEGDHS
jgi:hypothetical protein